MTSHDATERVEHIKVEIIASVPNTFPLPASFLMMGSSVVVTLWKMRLFWARLRSFLVVTRSYSLSYTSILPALHRSVGLAISGNFNLTSLGKSISSRTFQLSRTTTEALRSFVCCWYRSFHLL